MASIRQREDEATGTTSSLSGDEVKLAKVSRKESPSCGPSCASQPMVNPLTRRPFSECYFEILSGRQRLPVYEKKSLIQDTIRRHSVTLLIGETGSGKTTQVPAFLAEMYDAFPGLVACTQPRRIATLSVASRVATELDVTLGEEVGYHVRFQSRQSSKTRLLYLTDGMLLREAFTDADLSKYSVVVVDEAHERTVDTDIVLGLLKLLVARRPMFRLVVMSATLDIAKIQSFFPSAPLLQVSGRMYDVDVRYTPKPVMDYVEVSVECVTQIHEREPAGDILCFLTGEREIERAVDTAKSRLAVAEKELGDHGAVTQTSSDDVNGSGRKPTKVVVLPLYGSLCLTDQVKVFQSYPSDTRKVIFSTNIAETSVTIDGIVYVVDCGYQKQSLYNSEARVDYLLPAVISKASAKQRKGRAGRTRPGKCFRLFTINDYALFPNQTHPEILRTNIASTVLRLLKLGIDNPCVFPFIDPPSEQGLGDAFYQLMYFGAVDGDLRLTEFGKKMAEFPVDPCLARMLLKSADHGCAGDAAVVAAMLEVGQIFVRPPARAQEADQARTAFQSPEGDHLTLFFAYHGYYHHQQSAHYCWDHFLKHQAMQQAVQIYSQIRQLMTRFQIPVISTYKADDNTVDTVALRKAILEGFFTQVAYLSPGADKYRTVREGLSVALHRQSVLSKAARRRPQWVLYDRLEVQGEEGTFIRIGSAVEVEWLLDVSEFYAQPSEIGDAEIALALSTASRSRGKL